MSNTKTHIQIHCRQTTENQIHNEMKPTLQIKKIICHYLDQLDINMQSENLDIIWKGNTINPNKLNNLSDISLPIFVF